MSEEKREADWNKEGKTRRQLEEEKETEREKERKREATRQNHYTRSWLEREGAWPWPPLRGNSVKVSADELPLSGGRRTRRSAESAYGGEDVVPIARAQGPPSRRLIGRARHDHDGSARARSAVTSSIENTMNSLGGPL